MPDTTVLYEDRGAVALLTLNRPDALNSFTRAMHGDLWAALERLGITAAVHPGSGLWNPEWTSHAPFIEKMKGRLSEMALLREAGGGPFAGGGNGANLGFSATGELGHPLAPVISPWLDNHMFVGAALIGFTVMQRYPRMKVVMAHGKASWMEEVLEKMEASALTTPLLHKYPVRTDPEEMWEEGEVMLGFDAEERLIQRLPDDFEAKIVWGSHYPRQEATTAWDAIAQLSGAGVDQCARRFRRRHLVAGAEHEQAGEGAGERGARAEVQIGAGTLRIDGGSDVEFTQLDDARVHVRVHGGSVALRVRSSSSAREFAIVTAEGRFMPRQRGHYRVDRRAGTSMATVWDGSLRFESEDSELDVREGQRVDFWSERGRTHYATATMDRDDFTDWVVASERKYGQLARRYVSPEMTGAYDLDHHGSWDTHPQYGAVWYPRSVAADWAPYRYGRWTYVSPWGWTWVDDAPWGFAPFHYGRWVNWRGRWCWTSPATCPRRPGNRPSPSPCRAWPGASRTSSTPR